MFGFFSGGFFLGNENSSEKVFFFATIVKLNSQNKIKSFPFSRYKELSLLAALRKHFIFCSPKNSIKWKALFPMWNLKPCKFYGVSNTEKQFDFTRKSIPVAHHCFRRPTGYSFWYNNHIFQEWNLHKQKMLSTSYKFSKKDLSCNCADTTQICILLPFPSDLFCVWFNGLICFPSQSKLK